MYSNFLDRQAKIIKWLPMSAHHFCYYFLYPKCFCMLFSHSNDKFSNTFKEKQLTRCGTTNAKNPSTDGRIKHFIRHIATLKARGGSRGKKTS